MIFSLESICHFRLSDLYAWLVRIPIIIGAAVLMQSILALQYVRNPLRSFPVFGIVVALLAILGDIVLVLSVLTPGL
jgi:hypothetical protein